MGHIKKYAYIEQTLLIFLNLQMRSGYGRSIFEPLLPLILGRDISGEVAAVGASVSSLTIGQEVFGALHPTAVRGTYADYAILSEDELTRKPLSVSHVVCLSTLSLFRILINFCAFHSIVICNSLVVFNMVTYHWSIGTLNHLIWIDITILP